MTSPNLINRGVLIRQCFYMPGMMRIIIRLKFLSPHLQSAIAVLIKILNTTVKECFTGECISMRH